jgi:hypothetical protein
MATDHKTATTTPSIDDVRAVATAYARVAADLCDDAYVRRMCVELRLRDLDAIGRYVPSFVEEYRRYLPSLPRDVDIRCAAAFTIEAAASTYAETDAHKAILATRTARSQCERLVQRIDFGAVDLNGPNHAASQAEVDALASKYVSAETIAAVLA